MAALGAAFCWTWTMLFFSMAGKRIGSLSVNVIRLTIALPLLLIMTIILFGVDFNEIFAGGNGRYLLLSGLIGLTLGDAALFQALVWIGPRKTSLVFASVPIATSLIAFVTIDERLSLIAWVSIFITIFGICWVVMEKSRDKETAAGRSLLPGIIAALIGVIGQAAGLVLSKAGMADVVDPLPATFLRIAAGALGIYIYIIISGKIGVVLRGLRDKKALAFTMGGAFFGPFAGVWLSVIAIKYTETGIAATLTATVPIMMLPVVYFVFKERISGRTLIGTIIAVAGIALLFNR
ncbi:MAG: DMT family transporter [Candidatus Hatepunaea meridiana]|nr:DMT family transporter [Candidatus Hatepunaea meridiana]